MSNVLFDIKNLSFSFSKKLILKSISMKIYERDYLSIIGPNGAGKTTLLKCLIRIYQTPKKTIFLNETPIEDFNQKRLAAQISYVPQGNERFFSFTVEEFVMMARYPHLSPFTSIGKKDKSAVEESLELTNITHIAGRQMNNLSGGERQMVYIAGALAQGSKVILLDEPTTFLDPKHEYDIYRILKKIHSQTNRTIVSVTHDINSALLQGDKIAILKNGQIIFYGDSDEVTKNDTLEKAYDKKFTLIKHPTIDRLIVAPEVV